MCPCAAKRDTRVMATSVAHYCCLTCGLVILRVGVRLCSLYWWALLTAYWSFYMHALSWSPPKFIANLAGGCDCAKLPGGGGCLHVVQSVGYLDSCGHYLVGEFASIRAQQQDPGDSTTTASSNPPCT